MRGRRGVFTAILIGGALLFVAAVFPLPLYLIAPGNAVDLSAAVSLRPRPAPHDRFYLTDVSLIRASPLRLALTLFPGVRITKLETIVPSGESARAFDDSMRAEMTQSQTIAAVVGERAAGYRIASPDARVSIAGIAPDSFVGRRLAIGDVIERIDGRAVHADGDVRSRLANVRAGAPVHLSIVRAGRRRSVDVRTTRLDGRTLLGVILESRYGAAHLAVPVHYAIGEIGGSSGGLMMALRIYDALHGSSAPGDRRIAGTGTIALSGAVGPIEGTAQKLIAAKRAGARVFFVPLANYGEVAHERDVRVIPVRDFGQAVRALRG